MEAPIDDSFLWRSFKKGDVKSFQSLYHTYFDTLFEYGMRLVNNADLVKDGIHDLFVKLWNNRGSLGDVATIRPYLLVALRSTLYNSLEKESRIKSTDAFEQLPFAMTFSAESELILKESTSAQEAQLIKALNKLTARQKEVLYLRYFEQMSYEEIADIMKITVKGTYKLSARALEALRQMLGPLPIVTLLMLLTKSKWFILFS